MTTQDRYSEQMERQRLMRAISQAEDMAARYASYGYTDQAQAWRIAADNAKASLRDLTGDRT